MDGNPIYIIRVKNIFVLSPRVLDVQSNTLFLMGRQHIIIHMFRRFTNPCGYEEKKSNQNHYERDSLML